MYFTWQQRVVCLHRICVENSNTRRRKVRMRIQKFLDIMLKFEKDLTRNRNANFINFQMLEFPSSIEISILN